MSDVQSKNLGVEGQYLYYKENNVMSPSYIMNPVTVATTAVEIEAAKGAGEDFKRVFDTYQRISMHTSKPDKNNAYPNELNTWQLINSRIQCTLNTASFVGFVSADAYEDYVFEVNLWVGGTSGDDDYIGLLLGYVEVNGQIHTLSYVRDRQPGLGGGVLNYNLAGARGVKLAQRFLSPKETGIWDTTATAGCRVKVTRKGNLLVCESTKGYKTVAQRDAAAFEAAYRIEFDLNSNPTTRHFLGPQRYGYCALSQDKSTYEVISKPGGSAPIYNLADHTTWVKEGGTWVLKPTGDTYLLNTLYFDASKKRTYTFNGSRLKELS